MNSTAEIDSDVLEVLSQGSYRALTVTTLVVCSISVVFGAILATAMILPLLYPRKRAHYSTYNLYLAYMAIPDVVANGFVIYLFFAHNNYGHWKGEAENATWMFDHEFGHSTLVLCITGSLYVNSFLAFEIYRLLKNSNNLKRHSPPTIVRVTIQAIISYGCGIFFFLVDYWKSVQETIHGEQKQWNIMYETYTVIFVGLIPLSVLVVVCILIYKQKLIRSTESMYEGRLRVLFMYFARIVFTSLLHWMPAGIAYMISWTQEEVNSTKIVAFNVAVLFGASQAIVTFAFSLTKPDARELIFDLVNCAYCVECCGRGKGSEDSNSYFDDPYLRSNLPTARLFATMSSNITNFSTRNNQENKTIISEQSQQSSTHEKKNLDWADEKADPNHPQTGSSIRKDVVEAV